MSKTTNEITSPLQIVSSQQIEDLIFEEKLRNEGYKFCYTIEMKDIGDYCFPWGVYGNDIKDIDYTADILSTYEDFLFDMNTDIIFLDQYLFELLNLRNLILKIKERVGEIGNETKGFKQHKHTKTKS